jgi:UDP-N-acetyl-D-galactosamine dehydrogenase
LAIIPAVISSGRKVNDSMGEFIGSKVVKLLIQKGIQVSGSHSLILGVTFKENCPDIRNTRVVDIVSELKDYGVNVDVFDPWADKDEVKRELSLDLKQEITLANYDSVILAVAHKEFLDLNWSEVEGKVIFDVKAFLPRAIVDARL